MLEAGKRLIILKENEPHGDFVGIVEEQLIRMCAQHNE